MFILKGNRDKGHQKPKSSSELLLQTNFCDDIDTTNTAPSPHPEVRTERKRAERGEGRGVWGWRLFLTPFLTPTFHLRPNKTAGAIELNIFVVTPGIL